MCVVVSFKISDKIFYDIYQKIDDVVIIQLFYLTYKCHFKIKSRSE